MISEYNLKSLFLTAETRFGKNKSGTSETVKEYLSKTHSEIQIKLIELKLDSDSKISSSKIKELIRNGEVKEAQNLLGTIVKLKGEVVHGQKRGEQSVSQLRILTKSIQ